MSITQPDALKPLSRKRPEIDLEHFGKYTIGKLTEARQNKIDGLGEEMEALQVEAQPRILPAGATAADVERLREAGRDVKLFEDATEEEREQDESRVKAADEVLERRYVEIVCEQIETMLLVRDPNTKALAPADDVAAKLATAYRDKDVPEEKAVGIDDLTAILDAVMSVVDVEKAKGNS